MTEDRCTSVSDRSGLRCQAPKDHPTYYSHENVDAVTDSGWAVHELWYTKDSREEKDKERAFFWRVDQMMAYPEKYSKTDLANAMRKLNDRIKR